MRRSPVVLRGLLVPFLIGASTAFAASASSDTNLAAAIQKQDMAEAAALLALGADPNQQQPDGARPLHWAAHWNDLETAELLLARGADPNATNDYGATALSLACMNGSFPMVEKLLARGANPNSALPSGETPLMRCARSGGVAAVKALLAAKANVEAKDNEQGQTALMWAVAQKHPDVVAALIQGGANVKARTAGGFSPLLFAARVGDTQSAEHLLKAGADVNEKGPKGMTPLVLASASGREEFAVYVLDKGADPNAKDDSGATALHYAMLSGITALDGVRIANYVAHLFRPTQRELVKALLARKADPNVRLEKPVLVGGARGTATVGATPFLLAAASPDPVTMKVLADAGADTTMGTEGGITPLMAAAGLGRGQDYTEDEKRLAAEAVKFAFEKGGDVNGKNQSGLTALHGAATNGADAVIEFLASKGADLNARDQYQQTPLSIATGIRLPWIPYGDELGEIIQPSTRDLLLRLGATPVDAPGYFQEPKEFSDAYRLNQAQRYGGVPAPAPAPAAK
jgi:ankyrin repeat protein